jgi:hypothetical protein
MLILGIAKSKGLFPPGFTMLAIDHRQTGIPLCQIGISETDICSGRSILPASSANLLSPVRRAFNMLIIFYWV